MRPRPASSAGSRLRTLLDLRACVVPGLRSFEESEEHDAADPVEQYSADAHGCNGHH